MSGNEEQVAFWNGEAGRRWVEAQERMDALMAPITQGLFAAASPSAGERALDVGCGCGETSLMLAARGLAVTGIDISEPMLARASERSRGEARAIRFVKADAAEHAFDEGRFDLVLSRFGVMFFADPVRAFSNLRKAQAEGGRTVFVCWQSLANNPWFAVPLMAVRPFVPDMERPPPDAPGPFAFADPDRVRAILLGAGYGDVKIEATHPMLRMGSTLEETVENVQKLGPAARALATLPEETRGSAVAAIRQAIRQDGDAAPSFPAACWIVTAR